MPSDKKCCVPGCAETSAEDSHPVLHLFPNPVKEPERFNVWRSSVGGHILEIPIEHIYKYRRVCHTHFEKKYWCRYNRLSNLAVPTLNLPDSDIHDLGPNREQFKENIPESNSGRQQISMPRKRPLSSIENVMESLPSTSKAMRAADTVTITAKKFEDQDAKSATHVKSTNAIKIKAKTLNEKLLNRKLIAAKIKLSKFKNQIAKQAATIKQAKSIITNPNTLKALENLPKSARILTLLQFRESKKKNKGRRFTYDEKVLALSLLKQTPKGYRLLRKIFILPAPQTLIKLITRANIQPGINKNIFHQMKNQAQKMKPADKLCVLLFDEMSLKSNITYNERLDKIIGFVDNGETITKEFADHAQVFMIRGLLKNFKQPIGYTLSASATKGPELAKQIKEIVTEIQKAGLTVVATICDQGSGNRNAIKYLLEESRATWLRKGEEPKNNIILINEKEIVPLYDTPHLMKCVRNNLMTKNLKYVIDNQTKFAKWSHIERLYDENPAYRGIRIVPKLTENHVKPAKISKMKVKYATQIFSQTVAANMGYLAEKQVIPEECKDTADILMFFDQLFDSLNGSCNKKQYSKPALGPVTCNSVHHKIWREAKNMLKNMKFMKDGKIESVPTLNNWAWTLDSIEVLFNILNKHHGVGSIWMRHLNQDPLENFFGSIRSHGCRNTNPKPERFQSAFATLLVNNLSSVHAPGNNCEDDVASALHTLVIDEDCKAKNSDIEIDFNNFTEIEITPIEDKLQNLKIKASLEYCSGYFAKKSKDKIFKKCQTCNDNLISQNECEYIKYREFQKKRWLCSPSKELLKNISELQDLINVISKKNVDKPMLKELIKTLTLVFIDFNYIKCDLHKDKLIDFIINCVSRFFLHNYCKNINNILCGKRDIEDYEDMLQVRAKTFFRKMYKKRK